MSVFFIRPKVPQGHEPHLFNQLLYLHFLCAWLMLDAQLYLLNGWKASEYTHRKKKKEWMIQMNEWWKKYIRPKKKKKYDHPPNKVS